MSQHDAGGVDPDRIRTVLCDLDGVVWLAHDPIPGSVAAIEDLRRSGRRVLFVTNNSRSTIADQVATLAAAGIPAEGDVVSSATAAAYVVGPGSSVLVTGGPGVYEAIEQIGADAILNTGEDVGDVDAVVVGLHHEFDYYRLAVASRAVRSGATFIATNTDATYPTPRGEEPGGGAIVAAVVTAAGEQPIIAGKPHSPMAQLIRDMLGDDGEFDPLSVLMVGDRPETDGLFAATLGSPYAQVRTGVVPPGAALPTNVRATFDTDDLAALGRLLVP